MNTRNVGESWSTMVGGMIAAANSKERLVPRKVFAHPFRLTFEKRSGETTLIEVKTQDGLREVIRRRDDGEISEIGGYTLELQLWGILAEHIGFMRPETTQSSLSTGLQPFGDPVAALGDDLAALCGGDDAGLQLLAEMRKAVHRREEEVRASTQGPYVKPDGVNLTPAGESELAEIVGEPLTEIDREAAHAEAMIAETDPEEETEFLDEAPVEGEVITGDEAADIGRRVEEAGMGELREEKDESAPE